MRSVCKMVIVGIVVAVLTPFAVAQNGTDCFDPRAGCVDPTFGGGWVIDGSQPASGGLGHLTFQADKIIAGGTAYSRWTLVRYDTAGNLDRTFGNNGYAQLPVKRPYALEGLWGVRIQPINGQNYILTTGITRPTGFSWAIARFTPSGQQDKTFGNSKDNFEILPFGSSSKYDSTGADIAVQSDGRIVSVGQYKTQLAVVRLLANGSFDTAFGSGGKFVSTNPSGSARAVAFQTMGGKQYILVAGGLVDQNDPEKKRLPILLRLRPDGQIDTDNFGIAGVASMSVDSNGFDNQFLSVAVIDAPSDQDRKIVVAGQTRVANTYNSRLVVARFDSNGKLESTFNDYVPPCVSSVGSDIAIQPVDPAPDYKIVVVGNCSVAGTPSDLAAMWRFNSDGTLDLSFGYQGAVLTNINGNGGGVGAILQSNGKFIVAGSAWVSGGTRFAVARYIE